MTDTTTTGTTARADATAAGFVYYGNAHDPEGNHTLWHFEHPDGRLLTIHTAGDTFIGATGRIRMSSRPGPDRVNPWGDRNREAGDAAELDGLLGP